MYAVIFSYNFDDDVAVYLYETEEEAIRHLREHILEEFRIDTEEDGLSSEYEINDDGRYGLITTHFFDHDDVTEVRVGQVYV